jgi:hypothetical protein
MNIVVIEFGSTRIDLYHTYKDAAESIGVSPRKLSEDLRRGPMWWRNYLVAFPNEYKSVKKRR